VWGAYVPPGSPAQAGELYCVRDQDNLDIFWQRIRDFRAWMAQKGQREKPLIITEYGVLFPEHYSDEDHRYFSQARVGLFMTRTFDLMLHETDSQIGYPYDADRLVQRWAWFSLSFDPDEMGGALFDPATHELRELGQTYGDYTSALLPAVDLMVTHAYPTPLAIPGDDAPVTVTLAAVVSNIGNISTTHPLSVAFYAGEPRAVDTYLIGALTIYGGLRGCADLEVVQMEWKDLALGQHPFFVEVSGVTGEPLSNNVAQAVCWWPQSVISCRLLSPNDEGRAFRMADSVAIRFENVSKHSGSLANAPVLCKSCSCRGACALVTRPNSYGSCET